MTSRLRHLSILSGAHLIAPALNIAILPIVLEFYDRGDFGQLAFYSALVTILATLYSARIELQIAKAKSCFTKTRLKITAISLSIKNQIIIGIPLIIILAVIFDKNYFWMAYLAAGVFFFSLLNIHNFFLLTQEESMLVAKGRVSASITESISQYILGVVTFKFSPLILAYIIGAVFSAKTLGLKFKIFSKKVRVWSGCKLKPAEIRNSRYATLSYSANSLAVHGVPIFFVMAYGDEFFGEFTLLQRTLGAGFYLASGIFTQFFIVGITNDDLLDRAQVLKSYLYSAFLFFIIILFIATTSAFLLPVYSKFLPITWSFNQQLISLSLLLFSVQSVVVPVSSFLNLIGKSKYQFLWDVGRLIIISLALSKCYVERFEFLDIFRVYIYLMILCYGVLMFMHLVFLSDSDSWENSNV